MSYGTALDRLQFLTVVAATGLVSFVIPRSAAVDPADPLLLIAFGLLLINLPALAASAKTSTPFLLAGTIIFVGASITFLRTNMPGDFLTPFKYLMNTGVVFMVYLAAATTLRRWTWLAGAYLGGLSVNAMIALYQVSDKSHKAACMTQGRACGMTDHPNELGHLLVAGIFIAISLMVLYRGPARLLLWLVIALYIAALAASGSMGATAGLVAGMAVLAAGSLWARPSLTSRWAVVAAILAIAAIGPLTQAVEGTKVAERVEEFATADSIGSTTLGERVDINTAAVGFLGAHPFTGIGSFRNRLPHPVHNIFLGAWFEAGLIGLTGVVVLLYGVYRAAAQALIAVRRRPIPLHACVTLAAMLAGLLVAAQVAPVGYRRNPWAPYWLAVAQSFIWIRLGREPAGLAQPGRIPVARRPRFAGRAPAGRAAPALEGAPLSGRGGTAG